MKRRPLPPPRTRTPPPARAVSAMSRFLSAAEDVKLVIAMLRRGDADAQREAMSMLVHMCGPQGRGRAAAAALAAAGAAGALAPVLARAITDRGGGGGDGGAWGADARADRLVGLAVASLKCVASEAGPPLGDAVVQFTSALLQVATGDREALAARLDACKALEGAAMSTENRAGVTNALHALHFARSLVRCAVSAATRGAMRAAAGALLVLVARVSDAQSRMTCELGTESSGGIVALCDALCCSDAALVCASCDALRALRGWRSPSCDYGGPAVDASGEFRHFAATDVLRLLARVMSRSSHLAAARAAAARLVMCCVSDAPESMCESLCQGGGGAALVALSLALVPASSISPASSSTSPPARASSTPEPGPPPPGRATGSVFRAEEDFLLVAEELVDALDGHPGALAVLAVSALHHRMAHFGGANVLEQLMVGTSRHDVSAFCVAVAHTIVTVRSVATAQEACVGQRHATRDASVVLALSIAGSLLEALLSGTAAPLDNAFALAQSPMSVDALLALQSSHSAESRSAAVGVLRAVLVAAPPCSTLGDALLARLGGRERLVPAVLQECFAAPPAGSPTQQRRVARAWALVDLLLATSESSCERHVSRPVVRALLSGRGAAAVAAIRANVGLAPLLRCVRMAFSESGAEAGGYSASAIVPRSDVVAAAANVVQSFDGIARDAAAGSETSWNDCMDAFCAAFEVLHDGEWPYGAADERLSHSHFVPTGVLAAAVWMVASAVDDGLARCSISPSLIFLARACAACKATARVLADTELPTVLARVLGERLSPLADAGGDHDHNAELDAVVALVEALSTEGGAASTLVLAGVPVHAMSAIALATMRSHDARCAAPIAADLRVLSALSGVGLSLSPASVVGLATVAARPESDSLAGPSDDGDALPVLALTVAADVVRSGCPSAAMLIACGELVDAAAKAILCSTSCESHADSQGHARRRVACQFLAAAVSAAEGSGALENLHFIRTREALFGTQKRGSAAESCSILGVLEGTRSASCDRAAVLALVSAWAAVASPVARMIASLPHFRSMLASAAAAYSARCDERAGGATSIEDAAVDPARCGSRSESDATSAAFCSTSEVAAEACSLHALSVLASVVAASSHATRELAATGALDTACRALCSSKIRVAAASQLLIGMLSGDASSAATDRAARAAAQAVAFRLRYFESGAVADEDMPAFVACARVIDAIVARKGGVRLVAPCLHVLARVLRGARGGAAGPADRAARPAVSGVSRTLALSACAEAAHTVCACAARLPDEPQLAPSFRCVVAAAVAAAARRGDCEFGVRVLGAVSTADPALAGTAVADGALAVLCDVVRQSPMIFSTDGARSIGHALLAIAATRLDRTSAAEARRVAAALSASVSSWLRSNGAETHCVLCVNVCSCARRKMMTSGITQPLHCACSTVVRDSKPARKLGAPRRRGDLLTHRQGLASCRRLGRNPGQLVRRGTLLEKPCDRGSVLSQTAWPNRACYCATCITKCAQTCTHAVDVHAPLENPSSCE